MLVLNVTLVLYQDDVGKPVSVNGHFQGNFEVVVIQIQKSEVRNQGSVNSSQIPRLASTRPVKLT